MNAIPSNKCGNIVDAKMWICSVSSIHNKAYFCFLSYFKFMDACVFVRVVLPIFTSFYVCQCKQSNILSAWYPVAFAST